MNLPDASIFETTEFKFKTVLEHLRSHGKRVMCHLEDASGIALYTCAAANRILVHPAGGVRFAGLKSQTFYYASLLQKLGIRAVIVMPTTTMRMILDVRRISLEAAYASERGGRQMAAQPMLLTGA